MKTFSIAEARNRLPSILHEVEAGPEVELTRHGQSVAVVMSSERYRSLLGGGAGFWDAVTRFRGDRRAGDWLDDTDLEGLRDASPGRDMDLG